MIGEKPGNSHPTRGRRRAQQKPRSDASLGGSPGPHTEMLRDGPSSGFARGQPPTEERPPGSPLAGPFAVEDMMSGTEVVRTISHLSRNCENRKHRPRTGPKKSPGRS